MRPDLPWNVAGIPPEAREAARAAARREGLSVGEWLTRRILRSFADAGDEDELTRDSFAASRTYRDEPVSQPSRRDTDEMLDHVSRSATESNDVYRRIEEQMRNVARRLDSSERSQSENNRALNRAATEMNIATREQAQAFDQLGSHVVGLKERIDRVEQATKNDGMKEAVKGLHTGLARLADQLAQNANQSASQISALATNLETIAGRVGESRADSESTAQILEQRIAALDDRIYAVEKAAQTNTNAVERAIEALQSAHRDHGAQAENREAATSGVIARLQDSVNSLEARGSDPEIERRLSGIENSLASIVQRFDGEEPVTVRAVEDSLKKLLNRVEATENRQRDTVSEFRSVLSDMTARMGALENKPSAVAAPVAQAPSFVAPAAPSFAAPSFDAPPFPDVPTPGAPPPFAASHDPFAPASPFDSHASLDAAPPPFADEGAFEPLPDYAANPFTASPPPAGDSYLSAARRSAQAAASAAEAEHASRGFAWGSSKAASGDKESSGRSRTVLLAFVTLIAIALVAGIVLSQGFGGHPQIPSAGALFNKPADTAPQAATPLHATTQGDDLAPHAPASMPVPATATPNAQAKPAVVAPLEQKPVNAAPVHTVPAPATPNAKAPAPVQTAAVPALDHITALANGGNAKAETIIGLKYLNGDGIPVNEAQAAKWLERAAESGEPVAQYRLGYLYERGKGVPTDAAKATHWYQAAAMQGNRKAMHNLAVAYAEGTGTKKDPAEAARWFSKAATLGLTDSQFNLAVLYERGQGVPQSLLDAYKWYAIAAAGGDAESKSRLDALSTQLSADDRAAAQHAVDTFKPVAADPRANMPPQQGDLPH
jgi:localization factor PodJL